MFDNGRWRWDNGDRLCFRLGLDWLDWLVWRDIHRDRLRLARRGVGTWLLHHELDREFLSDSLRLRYQGMWERRGLNGFGRRALFAKFAPAIAGQDLLRERLDCVDRQNRRRHIVATVSREHVRSFTGSHHEPLSADTFKRRTKRRHQTHSSASCSCRTSSN